MERMTREATSSEGGTQGALAAAQLAGGAFDRRTS